ncbi:FAD-binding oxidoreductase [Myceligenerans xiligouense]|uniref:FAD/FMN-containing dehydrogenase n=1 Tax=Myceligenerans xiligouense TaxID=253184 RepID=A0A3N4YKR8_9MICO|nr:FAD-binding oxidoreductase [Myceligenerans xiligouense]RPF20677.1 FAD/FMN-containing dehydrogenase [Myceligenerans xiligouense]
MSVSPLHPAFAALAETLGDRLLTPASPDLGTLAATVFDGEPRVPAVLTRPRTTGEVSGVVRAARAAGLPLTVRSGGHSYARSSLLDGGVVLDLRLMDEIRIDPEARTGHAQGGASAGAYTTAAGEHGLATGFGDTGSVGIAGLTLGGGVGFLSRRDGLTLDNLLGAEVVLADGEVVETGPDVEPDLFWALRGGSAGTGVVTRLDLRLTEAADVVGGFIAWRPDPEVVGDVVTAIAQAPDELSGMVNVMLAPPAPFLPAEVHGQPLVMALVCWSGAPEAADDVLAPLRAHAPLVDLVEPKPYPAMFEGGGPETAGMHAAVETGFTGVPDVDTAVAMIDAVRAAPAGAAVFNLRVMGGAIARVGAGETAFAHRDRAVMATVAGLTPDPAKEAEVRSWVSASAARIAADRGPAYVNFLPGTGPEQLARAYPGATGERLRAVRAKYGTLGSPA